MTEDELRDVEATCKFIKTTAGVDMSWLVAEVRRLREALRSVHSILMHVGSEPGLPVYEARARAREALGEGEGAP